MILVAPLLSFLINNVGTLIQHYMGIVLDSEVKQELEKLQTTLEIIHLVLEDAEEKQITDKPLEHWLSKIKDSAYEAEDLLEELTLCFMERKSVARYRDKIVSKIHCCFYCGDGKANRVFDVKMVHKVRGMVKKFDLLAEGRSKFHLNEKSALGEPTKDYKRRETQSIPETKPVGREADVEQIVKLLIGQEHSEDVSVLPIVGMGGLGKTTLAQMVYNHKAVRDHFKKQMWVFAAHDFAADKIVKNMIQNASGSKFDLYDLDSLHKELRKVIGRHRYLLVLDDVWCEESQRWAELRAMLNFGAKGSAVVVTTCSGIVSRITGTLGDHRLGKLSGEDCWDLLRRKAFSKTKETPALLSIGRAVADKCGGLPLAAKVLGSLLHLKTEERQWKEVMERLESEIWDLQLGNDGILPGLGVSYHYLRPQLKQCFIFCAVFPRGYIMEKEMLIQLWMAHGFIQPNARIDMLHRGQDIFQELVERSFFQDVEEVRREHDGKRITTCGMHGVFHDLARSIMGNECCVLDKPEDALGREFRHMFVSYSTFKTQQSDTTASKYTRTHTLLFGNNQCDLTNWVNANHLHVLGLHGTNLVEFPMSACNFRHLRYLDLSYNGFQTLPENISRLFNLQTLNLSACWELRELPKSVTAMRSLVNLYLEGCTSLIRMPEGMGQLTCLKALTKYVECGEPGSGSIGELKDLNLHGMLQLCNLKSIDNVADAKGANLGSKENLEELDLDWGEWDVEHRVGFTPEVLQRLESDPNAKELLKWERRLGIMTEAFQSLQTHPNLKRLAVRRFRGAGFPTWLMTGYLANLTELVLANCVKCEHLPQLGQLLHLEVLEIGAMGAVKSIGGDEFYGAEGAAFPSLRRLKITGMGGLEEWLNPEEWSHFPCIEEIAIIDCPKLTTIPAFPSARSFRIEFCGGLRPGKGFFGCMKSLERLKLKSCDRTVLMLEEEEGEDGHEYSLRYLRIESCKQLMFSSPSLGLWKHFNSLRKLKIVSCNGLVQFPVDVIEGLRSLQKLAIDRCYKLTYSSSSEQGLLSRGLPALEELSITDCPGVISLPVYLQQRLSSLNYLRIKYCPDLFEGLRSLQKLAIDCFYKLTYSSPSSSSSSERGLLSRGLLALEELSITDCPGVISLPVYLQQRLSSLNYLQIKYCPDLQIACTEGGEYWDLVSQIPVKYTDDISWHEALWQN